MSSQVREQKKLRERLAIEDRMANAEAMERRIPEKETVPWKSMQSKTGKFSPWLLNQITSPDELASRCQDVAFVAFDTKWREWRDPANTSPHQYSQCMEVGLSLLVNLRQQEEISPTDEPCLSSLVRQFDVQVKNTRVNAWYRGQLKVPAEDFPFGATNYIDLEDLDGEVDSQLQHFKKQARGRPLILVGFDVRYDLSHFWRDFPTGARHFSAWVDLDDLMKNSNSRNVPTMGLGEALRSLGYSPDESPHPILGTGQHKRGQIAAMESVRILALLEAVTRTNDDVASRLCMSDKPNFPFLRELPDEPWTFPSKKFRVQITSARGPSEALPREIDSILKLANVVYDRGNLARLVGGWGRGPSSVEYTRGATWTCKGVRADRRQIGFLEFADEDKMARFARDATTRRKYQDEKRQSDDRKRKEREQKKQTQLDEMLDIKGGEDLDSGLEGLMAGWM
ncbi:hypothetical protein PG985_002488 [Apiospora marii]|uniref:uncharacterized protein n=1 Tax=Apiospora marii TaxID=335849 RepID=UPI00312DA613